MSIAFADEQMLRLLTAPAVLLVLCLWRLWWRVDDRRRLQTRRLVPTRERLNAFSDVIFSLGAITSITLLVLALARPVLPTTLPQRPGLDVVVLQDASASMRVADTEAGDRWQRAMTFLREFGDALSWNNDRLAMVTFARIAAPQIRLTRDPNTLFFFLDHLHARPPFRLDDDTTWDTNLEHAVNWGLRIVDKDQEIHGRSPNLPAFIMLSDGEAWTGKAATAVQRVRERGIPIFVVGVGTLGGGPLPVVRLATGQVFDSPGISRLERAALQRIADAADGRYFELGRESDRDIANTIISEGRRLAPALGLQHVSEDLYWWFIVAAAAVALVSLAFVRRHVELGILLAGSIVGAIVLSPVLW